MLLIGNEPGFIATAAVGKKYDMIRDNFMRRLSVSVPFVKQVWDTLIMLPDTE